MKLKQKLIGLCAALFLALCTAVATIVPAVGENAPMSWSKSSSAGTGVTLTTTGDGGVQFAEPATGAWDGCFYTAGYYNYDVPVENGLDMYLDIKSGQVGIVLSGNGWAFNQQGGDNSVLNWNPTVLVVLTHYGEEIQFQRIDTWDTVKVPKLEGYNKLSFDIDENGTTVLFNGEEVFAFASTIADYAASNGMATVTINRFSAETVLDTVVRDIPVAKNSEVSYNNQGASGLNLGYYGVSNVTGVKYAFGNSDEYTSVDMSKIAVTANTASIDAQTSKEAFSQVGTYKVVLETTYGNVYYNVTVASEKDATAMWTADAASNAYFTATEDGAIAFSNELSSIVEGTRVYDLSYNGAFSVEEDVVIDFTVPEIGFALFALTDGANGNSLVETSVRNTNSSEDQTKFCYTLDYTNYPYAMKNASGYTRLTYKIGETATEVFADGVSLGSVNVGKNAFTSGKVGVKVGTFYWSWAMSTAYNVRVGVATAVNGTARYVQTSNKGVTFTYNAPFAPVTAVKKDGVELPAENYTLVEAKESVGSLTFTAAQIDALCSATGEYTFTLETAMGNVEFTLQVVAPSALELVQNSFTYDVYAGGDLTVAVYSNMDSVTAVKNGEKTLTAGSDYVFDANSDTLVVKENYLKTLNKGNNILSIITQANANGVALNVTVIDRAPPTVSGNASVKFDKKATAQNDVVFAFDMKDNAFVSVAGNNITAENYTFSGARLTIKKEFLANFVANATYEFVVKFTYGDVNVCVEVANTTAPTANVASKNYNPSLPNNVTFTVEIYESAFVGFTGNGITANDYTFENGQLVIKKEYLATLTSNTYSFNFATEVGSVALTVVVEEKTPPMASATTAIFDVQNAQDVTFTINMNNGALQSFTGNDITKNDYTFNSGVLVLKGDYLATLCVGEYTFTFEANNGILSFVVTVKNEVAPNFSETSNVTKKYVRVEDITADMEIKVYANLGKLISIDGDNISEGDYTFANDLLVIKKEYLATLGLGDNGLYNLVFDNGTLTLEIRFDYPLQGDYAYVENGATVSDGGDGFVKISQTAVQGAFVWGYVADYAMAVNVNEPITILYEFPQNPDETWMYTVNVSGAAHDYFWETTKTVFAQFGVNGNSFNQLRAGSYPSDEYNYLTVAGLVCNANGINALTFDIGTENTKIYLNGVLINTSPRTRADFADGKAYVRFSSTTTYTESTPYCEYLALVNGGVKADVAEQQFSLKAPQKVEWNLTFDNGQFVGLYLQNEQGALVELSNYRFLYSEYTKSGVLTLETEDVLSDARLAQAGVYTLVVKSTGGQASLSLTVSNKEDLEISQDEFIFDQRAEENLCMNVWLNVDTFVGVSGNGITENDYAYADGVLTIFYSYLATLEYGKKTFVIISERNSDGLTFTIQVVDYSDPELENDAVSFDIQNPANVVVRLDVKAGTFVSVTGNYITQSDYTFDQATGNITFNSEFFKDFEVGKYTFTVNVDVFGTAYTVELKVSITNSQKPSFSDGTALTSVVFDKNKPADITLTITPNNCKFLALYGSYISSVDYTYNEATGMIVIKASYMETLSVGTKNTVNINFDNGKIDVVIEIVETEQTNDSTQDSGTSSGGCMSTASVFGNGIMLVITCVGAGAILLRRRKNENE